jgi:hypothetical protein
MRIILANDTSGTSNPGCKGTVSGLLSCLSSDGHEVVSRVPVGYGYHRFARVCRSREAKPIFLGQKRLVASAKMLLTGSLPQPQTPSHLCRDTWEGIVTAEIPRLAALWAGADALVVNGEGTIHDDAIGALTLLGLCKIAKLLGLNVALVNCSIYELSDWLLDIIRQDVDFLSVREPLSREYLLYHGITAHQSADCLFAADHLRSISQDNRDEVQRPVIYTPGVLAGGAKVSAGAVARDVRALADGGVPVHYLVVEEEDEWVAPAAAEAGASVIPLGSIPWERITDYLGSAKCVVSGRYHINIFSMLAGVPFLPMETNTPKMKGVLRLVGVGDRGSIRSWSEEKAPDLQDAILVPAEAVERSCRMASDVIKGWYPA